MTRVIVVFYAAVPLSIGIAILKYRLYDIDNVIRKVLIMACRGIFVFVYAVVVGGIAGAAGVLCNSTLSFVAAVMVAAPPPAGARPSPTDPYAQLVDVENVICAWSRSVQWQR